MLLSAKVDMIEDELRNSGFEVARYFDGCSASLKNRNVYQLNVEPMLDLPFDVTFNKLVVGRFWGVLVTAA